MSCGIVAFACYEGSRPSADVNKTTDAGGMVSNPALEVEMKEIKG